MYICLRAFLCKSLKKSCFLQLVVILHIFSLQAACSVNELLINITIYYLISQPCTPMPEIKQLPMHPQVLDKGSCVNESYCKTCDDEGHRTGDVWQTDPCTTCECTDRGSSCSTKTCPHLLLCEEGYSLEEVSALPYTSVLDICY